MSSFYSNSKSVEHKKRDGLQHVQAAVFHKMEVDGDWNGQDSNRSKKN